MVRFALTPPAPKKAPWEPCAAQLALARVHPGLVPLRAVGSGYEPSPEPHWFECASGRGFAGYGLARALRMLLDVLTSLGALHETKTNLGVPFVHGELCPALLRVDDSGVTRLVPLTAWHWSRAGVAASKDRLGHLAPERLLGDALDHRADVFSAGVLLWEALAGRRLFQDEGVDAIITRLMGGKVHLPALPPELSWALPLKPIALCALSVDPEQRFANCAEFVAAIEAVAACQIASHHDVAAYFSAPHQSVLAPAPQVYNHNSSLSALVSAVEHEPTPRVSVLEQVAPELHVTRARPVPRTRTNKAPFVLALVAGAALGMTVLARHPRGVSTGSANSTIAAMPTRLAASSAALDLPPQVGRAPLTITVPAVPPAGTEAAPAAPDSGVHALPGTSGSLNSAREPAKSVKNQRPARTVPAPARLKMPSSPPRARDREAEQYGI